MVDTFDSFNLLAIATALSSQTVRRAEYKDNLLFSRIKRTNETANRYVLALTNVDEALSMTLAGVNLLKTTSF